MALPDGFEEECLYVALRRSSADAWLPSHGRRPFTPPALGSHAVVVALQAEGTEAALRVEGEERLSLAVDNAVLTPTSSRYRPANRGRNPRLVVVVGMRRDAEDMRQSASLCWERTGREAGQGVRRQGPPEAAAEGAFLARQPEAPEPDLSGPAGDALDVEAHMEAALALIMAAPGELPAADCGRARGVRPQPRALPTDGGHRY